MSDIQRSSHPFRFRPQTNDESVFQAVCANNEYRLPDTLDPKGLVIDIGAHIGSFCYAVLKRGAERVFGFEPDADNFNCAVENLRGFGQRVHLSSKAIWRSDVADQALAIGRIDDNLGGWSMIWGLAEGVSIKEEVSVIGLDDAIRQITNGGRQRVQILKIDCEGAEFPILFTSRTLHLVDGICGEFHELGGDYDPFGIPERFKVPGVERFTIVELTNKLQEAGFSVSSVRHDTTNMGLFFAARGVSTLSCLDRLKFIWRSWRANSQT
ncbi:MAG: FkbM family methyltransferase [Chloroflexi bacterium]|nr:FkbM family methyltransferase [Chloroflexota bacterium]